MKAKTRKPDWGLVAIVAATVTIVGMVFVGTCVRKVGGCGASSLGRHHYAAKAEGVGRVHVPVHTEGDAARVALTSRQESRNVEPGGESGQPPMSFSQVSGLRSQACFGAVAPAGRAESVTPHADAPGGRLLDAIREVESGGNDYAVGDGGRSKGPYQCGRLAWADGGGNPDDYDRLVWDRRECEKVMVRYWQRYGARTDEERARLWNGGPRWREKPATEEYWRRVRAKGIGR